VGKKEEGLRARLRAWSLFVDNDKTFREHDIDVDRDHISMVLATAVCSDHSWLFFGVHKEAIYVSIHMYDKDKFNGELMVHDESTKYIVGKFTRDYSEFIYGNKPMPNEIMRIVSGDKLVDFLCEMFSNKNQLPVSNIVEFKRVRK